MYRAASASATFCILILASTVFPASAQTPNGKAKDDSEKLQFVVYLSRHGVRSPTGKTAQYNLYAAAPWPEWDVPPGHLTPHGYKLMTLFGAYDRARLVADGLLAPNGCTDAAHVTILADSDQRTRETGKAIAEGMFPGCTVSVHALPEGTNDPLFHSLPTQITPSDRALALAAVAGRIGGDPKNLTEAYRPQLAVLERVLAGCSGAPPPTRTSLFDVPSSLGPGKGDHPVELRGPLSVASTLSENLLLEYTDGMSGSNLAWNCMDQPTLRSVMQLHTAAADFAQRTPVIARMYALNLLDHVLKSLEQSATGKPVAGAPGTPGGRVLFLVGHDTNIATVAGALGLTWIIDGRRDDTPPGGALVFELWRSAAGAYSVRMEYTAQTLDQMRDASALTLDSPPARVPVFIPGCSQPDQSCNLGEFSAAVHRAIDPARSAGSQDRSRKSPF
jgi:4-phytase/acid phosphatase